MEENELLAAARIGNQDAFARLYQLHVGYVRGVIRSITRNQDTDDLCQDTFMLAFTRLASFEGTAQFRTWLTRIAVNQCFMSLRRNGCKAQVLQIDVATLIEDLTALVSPQSVALEQIAFGALGELVAAVQALDNSSAAAGVNVSFDATVVAEVQKLVTNFPQVVAEVEAAFPKAK